MTSMMSARAVSWEKLYTPISARIAAPVKLMLPEEDPFRPERAAEEITWGEVMGALSLLLGAGAVDATADPAPHLGGPVKGFCSME